MTRLLGALQGAATTQCICREDYHPSAAQQLTLLLVPTLHQRLLMLSYLPAVTLQPFQTRNDGIALKDCPHGIIPSVEIAK